MPKVNVQKSITINAPVEKVFKTLSDFHHWQAWSPWLVTEPEAKVKVNEDGKYYEWEGKRVGSGNMSIKQASAPDSIDYDLNFLKPWKSSSKVKFECQSKGKGTEVTWYMDSSLPFYMFWMKKMMIAYIGADYDRGLNMLKDYVEDGNIKSSLDFIGNTTYEGCQYIGIKGDSSMDTFGPEMQKDFEKLMAYCKDKGLEASGYPFSIYHKFDMVKNKVSYTGGVPLENIPDDLPAGFIKSEIPSVQIYKLRHVGAYKHLGNAWSTMYSMHRNKEIKPIKKIHPFELYVNGPNEVSEEKLITDICFAIK